MIITLESYSTVAKSFQVMRNEKGPLKETCCMSGRLCSPADSCDTTHRDRVVELFSKATQHSTDSVWWSIGSDTYHLVWISNRQSPWICWTSSRITSPATPAVQLRTLFTAQEISYQVSCLAILSPGTVTKYAVNLWKWKCSGTLRWLLTLQVQALDSCGR